MTESDRSRLADFAYWTGVAGIVVAVLGILGVQVGVWPAMAAFTAFAFGTLICGGIAMLVGAVAVLRTRGRFGPAARKRAITATSLGLLLTAVLLVAAVGASDKPPINDITTDLADPPAFASAEWVSGYANRDMSYPADFVPIVRAAYPELEPIQLTGTPDQAYDRALASARALGWNITHEDRAAGTFDANETTAVFRFVDDVTVRVRPGPDGSRIDVRSKSRDGRGDLGANADRIQRFAAEIRLPPVASP